MNIRKAAEKDIDAVEAIYDHIHDEEEKGSAVIGWIRDVYPVRKTAEQSLKRGDLFVLEDGGKITAAAIINMVQVPDYKTAKWKYDAADDEVMVLHTLVVEPSEKGKGYGKAFVSFYEEYAAQHGCTELRMDTNARNSAARKMYSKLGFEETDIVPCVFNGIPDVQLVCLEKHI